MRDKEYEKTASDDEFVSYALSLTLEELEELHGEMSRRLWDIPHRKSVGLFPLFKTAHD